MNNYSIADALHLCGNHIIPDLIAPESMSANCRAAGVLPIGLSSTIGFEVRLGLGQTDAGFALNVQYPSFGWELLAGIQPGLDSALFQIPAWAGIQRLCRYVADPTADGYGQIRNLWLEFDIERPGVLTPDVFLGMATPSPERQRPYASLSAWPALLHGEPLADGLRVAVAHCFAGLPDRAFPNQLGLMLARTVEAMRLVISFQQPADALTYLAQIGWPSPNAELPATKSMPSLEWFNGLADLYALQIDVTTGGILPRVGIEARFFDPVDLSNRPRWEMLLKTLTERGLCTPEKCAALMAYPGATRELLGVPVVALRGLSHVKLVLHPDQPPSAKGYLGVLLLWKGLEPV